MPRSTFSKLLFVFLALASTARALPSFEETKAGLARSEWRLLDRHGEVIQELRADMRVRQLGWTPLGEISPALRSAVILGEDKRFYKHHGVDWLALGRAAFDRLRRKNTRGASTISMQVAAFLDSSLRPKRGRRDWLQKYFQIAGGRELEGRWSKDQILEAYLNLIYFRGELRGVQSAAKGLFGKTPSGLDDAESFLLTALIRGPESPAPRVQARACELAKRAGESELCARIALAAGAGLRARPFPPAVDLAPHAARILAKAGAEHSTLDRRLQARVREILRRQVLQLHDRNLQDAAALVVDNASGEVLAYVGSVGDLSAAGEVDGVRARRQAGSTLKPFLYSLALENRYLTPSSRLDDSAGDISLGTGAVYRPRDFDRVFHGPDVTLRQALGSSLNVPAVRTLQLVGVGRFLERLRALGFGDLQSEEFYGPSLALGSADVTLWELTGAFRTLANKGLFSELTLTPLKSPAERKRVIDEGAAFLVSDILSDRESRELTFGLDSPLGLPFWVAAKTGTSKDMRDNWCVGFTGRYTVGVWAGNFSGEPMWNVSGISGAAPAWAEILEALHRPGRDLAPKPPAGVARFDGEWYLRGTEPEPGLAAAPATIHRTRKITYPVEGLMLARDPDIPRDRQRVFFESDFPDEKLSWVLNNERLADAGRPFPWPPGHAGQYELKLVDKSGRAIDTVHFSIRGAAIR